MGTQNTEKKEQNPEKLEKPTKKIIKTNFIGQIIDPTKTYNFETRQWNTSILGDKYYSFNKNWEDHIRKAGFCPDFKNQDYIFMRWKEIFKEGEDEKGDITDLFENTFAYSGFHYICFSKITGEIKGYYSKALSSKQIDIASSCKEKELIATYATKNSSYYQVDPVFNFMG